MVDYAFPAAFKFDVAVINVVDRAVVALEVVYVMLGQPRLVREIVDAVVGAAVELELVLTKVKVDGDFTLVMKSK
jgi:hypothetical protein